MVESAADFFSRNASLFTVLGVFGAISVYFSQLAVGSRWQRLGIVASLTIFLLVAVAIWRNIPPETSDQAPFDYVVNQRLREPRFIIFYVAFLAVVISIVAVVLKLSNTFIFLISFLFFVVGVRIALWWVNFHSPFGRREFNFIEDKEAGHILVYIIRNGIQVFVISVGILALVGLQGAIPVEEALQFQFTGLWIAILIGICIGASAGGALYTSAGISGLFGRAMFSRLERGIEDLDKDEAEVITAIIRSLFGQAEEEEGENR
jgi:hypothetical protein